uniref:Uncharacterized protein n=1 Tax=Setaria italica TaxID=4555 RepID=K4AKW4_SETIT
MAHLINKDFTELAADGTNYLTWAMDVKIVLIAKDFIGTLNEPNPQAPIPEVDKFRTLHFLRHHLHLDLKNEYIMEDDPKKLRDSLKERHNQQQIVILPEAKCEWSLLHLMDFKFVEEYNSAVHKICSKLHFCNQPLDDAEMIEKILSTISLLTKNHQLRPVGAAPLSEVHFNAQNNNKKFGGKCTFKKHNHHDNSQVCQRCGCQSHTTRKCHTAKHLVDLYQKYIVKQVRGDKFELLQRCSCRTQHEKIPPQLDDLFSTDDMLVDSTDDVLVDFQSNDMFGDMN